MGKDSTKFLDKVVDISAGMSKHPISDDLKTKINVDAVLQHMELLLMQSTDSCLYRPSVCAGLNDLIFEAWTPHTERILRKRIELSLKFEPRISVTSMKLTNVRNDVDIEIVFRLADTDEQHVYRSTLRRVL